MTDAEIGFICCTFLCSLQEHEKLSRAFPSKKKGVNDAPAASSSSSSSASASRASDAHVVISPQPKKATASRAAPKAAGTPSAAVFTADRASQRSNQKIDEMLSRMKASNRRHKRVASEDSTLPGAPAEKRQRSDE